jgi:hypothetical protein
VPVGDEKHGLAPIYENLARSAILPCESTITAEEQTVDSEVEEKGRPGREN